MKPFIKVAAIAVSVQVALCIVLGLLTYMLSPGADSLAGSILYIYYPTVYSIWKIGYFAGESNMFMPIFLGVPLGIFVYGLIFSFIFTYFKQRYP
jgi:hypothetical protein